MALSIMECDDMAIVRELFCEYQESIGVDLCFQGFEEELATLPGKYARPGGAIFVALWDGDVAGCGALKAFGDQGSACGVQRSAFGQRSACGGRRSGNRTPRSVPRLTGRPWRPKFPACEMKRVFVRPAFRGLGIGRAIAVRLIEEARSMGYQAMKLDSLDTMKEAQALYRSLGFREIEPYYDNPHGGVFMEIALRNA